MPEAQHEESDPYLDTAGVAEMVGVSYYTIRFHLQQARANRKAGTSKPGDLPEPERTFGRSPVWRRSTIQAWVASRPGRGAGGGRPPKTTRSPGA